MTESLVRQSRRRRVVSVALASGAALVPCVAAAAATEPAPGTTPVTTAATETTSSAETSAAPDTTAAETTEPATTVPEIPSGRPVVIAETTFTFADGPYRWVSAHGSVLDTDGEVTLDEGSVTFLAATSGTLLVPQDSPDPYELRAGSAIPRDESLSTTMSVPEGAPAGYVAIDIDQGDGAGTDDGGAATTDALDVSTAGAETTVAGEPTATAVGTSAAGTTIADTTAAGDVAATPASFAPGAGPRTVTLHRVLIDPGASFDAASIEHEFGYVVVTKGVLDTAAGETLYTYTTLALPGDGALTNASESVVAEILVATVTGPPAAGSDTTAATSVPTTTTADATATTVAPSTAPEPLRFSIASAVDCSGPSITFSYDDHVDGHVPQAVHEEFDERGYIRWTADEVHQVDGDYFNERTFPLAGQSLSRSEIYGYMVMITYDDGLQQADAILVDLAEVCPATSPSTSPPSEPTTTGSG